MIDTELTAAGRVRATVVDPSLPFGVCKPQIPGDVGWDLVAMTDVPLAPMDGADVPVNLRLWLPPGIYVDIRNRSSMARRGLYVDQNLVDNGYRGPMYVFIRNMALPQMRALSDETIERARQGHGGLIVPGQAEPLYNGPNVARLPAEVDPGTVWIRGGERVAQLVFHRAERVWLEPTRTEDFEDDTERGSDGFGSTGA